MNPTEQHFRKLERMYATAPINRYFETTLHVDEGRAELTMPVRPEFFHAAHAVHGSVYFKALDDAAWFAANSLSLDVLLLTASFHLHLVRPVSSGELRATGVVVHQSRTLIVADSVVHDSGGRQVARGTGSFVRSQVRFSPEVGYA